MTVKQRKAKARKLYSACKAINRQKRAYRYGGGHKPWGQWTAHEGIDCSASICKALHDVGIFDGDQPVVSGMMEHMFSAGHGRWVTIYCNGDHVWMRFRLLGVYWRFDTSPWGDPAGSGPRMRRLPRSTAGFVARHPAGL